MSPSTPTGGEREWCSCGTRTIDDNGLVHGDACPRRLSPSGGVAGGAGELTEALFPTAQRIEWDGDDRGDVLNALITKPRDEAVGKVRADLRPAIERIKWRAVQRERERITRSEHEPMQAQDHLFCAVRDCEWTEDGSETFLEHVARVAGAAPEDQT